MFKKYLPIAAVSVLFGCAQPTDRAQQYIDDEFNSILNKSSLVESDKPRDFTEFHRQAELVVDNSPSLAATYQPLYEKLNEWVLQSGEPTEFANFGIQAAQLGGGDKKGNVLFTGYFLQSWSFVINRTRSSNIRFMANPLVKVIVLPVHKFMMVHLADKG